MASLRLLLLLLIPGLAWATSYTGYLIPNHYEEPTQLSLNLTIAGKKVTGSGKAFAGQSMDVSVISGSYSEGSCKISLEIKNYAEVTLNGMCAPDKVEGEFRMKIDTDEINRTESGRFTLTREGVAKTPGSDDAPAKRLSSRTECMKRNVACLSFCPRGDYNAEFLCVNHCRKKDAACKGKVRPGIQPLPSTSRGRDGGEPLSGEAGKAPGAEKETP